MSIGLVNMTAYGDSLPLGIPHEILRVSLAIFERIGNNSVPKLKITLQINSLQSCKEFYKDLQYWRSTGKRRLQRALSVSRFYSIRDQCNLLARYGFHQSHSQKALLATSGQLEMALRILVAFYFDTLLPDQKKIPTSVISNKINYLTVIGICKKFSSLFLELYKRRKDKQFEDLSCGDLIKECKISYCNQNRHLIEVRLPHGCDFYEECAYLIKNLFNDPKEVKISLAGVSSQKYVFEFDNDVTDREPQTMTHLNDKSTAVIKPDFLQEHPLCTDSMDAILRVNKTLRDTFKKTKRTKQYRNMQRHRKSLPATKKMKEIIDVIKLKQVVLISGETGSGKSTQVPQYIMDDWLKYGNTNQHLNIFCTQPRRVSAINLAERVSAERAEDIGKSVGYQIRFNTKKSIETRLTYCTTGILLRIFESDPLIKNITHLFIDEAHERNIEIELILLILKTILSDRPDLKIIIMSATLHIDIFSGYFGNLSVVQIPGKLYPVEQLFLEDIVYKTEYLAPEDTWSLYLIEDEIICFSLIEHLLIWIVFGNHEFPTNGSILVFLPGEGEIQQLKDLLEKSLFNEFSILPLHSSMTAEEQAEVLSHHENNVRKIILSTNIAETSVTVKDCVFVVDCGKVKEIWFNPITNMEHLETVWCSRANALQRRGRAGRCTPGVCFSLYTSHRFHHIFKDQPDPEIIRIPLQRIIFRIKTIPFLAKDDFYQVIDRFLQTPRVENISNELLRLQDVGALDKEYNITDLGKCLAAFPFDVMISKLVMFGVVFSALDAALTIASIMLNKSPFLNTFALRKSIKYHKHGKFSTKVKSDYLTTLKAFKAWIKACNEINTNFYYDEGMYLNENDLEMILETKNGLLEILVKDGIVPKYVRPQEKSNMVDEIGGINLNFNSNNEKLIAALLFAALYPNVTKNMAKKLYTKTNTQVLLHPSSMVYPLSYQSNHYMVYQKVLNTSKPYIFDCTMIPSIAIVLFSNEAMEVKHYIDDNIWIVSLGNGWSSFKVESIEAANMLHYARYLLTKLLNKIFQNPRITINSIDREILSTIVTLITETQFH